MKVFPILSFTFLSDLFVTADFNEEQSISNLYREYTEQSSSILLVPQDHLRSDVMKSALSYSVTRKLKSKKNKNTQAAKSSKAPKKKKTSKNPKSSRTPTSTLYTRHDCITVDTYKSNGSRLSNIIASMVKNQDFSSYCQTDFDRAEAWFVNAANHPTDGKENDNDYIKDRFTLSLLYSANCKGGCTLSTSDWLSSRDHCEWEGVTKCNWKNRVASLDFRDKGLSQQFTLFELEYLIEMDLRENNLSNEFVVAGGEAFSMNALLVLYLSYNRLTGLFRGGLLSNLRVLNLGANEFEGKLKITEQNFPLNINTLYLWENKLTGFVNGRLLRNLSILYLSSNDFTGELVITEDDFPTNIGRLELRGNELIGFRNGKVLKNLSMLTLALNEFSGDLVLTKKDFPDSLAILNLNHNTGLTNIHAENDVVPNLRKLHVLGNDDIVVSNELCARELEGTKKNCSN